MNFTTAKSSKYCSNLDYLLRIENTMPSRAATVHNGVVENHQQRRGHHATDGARADELQRATRFTANLWVTERAQQRRGLPIVSSLAVERYAKTGGRGMRRIVWRGGGGADDGHYVAVGYQTWNLK